MKRTCALVLLLLLGDGISQVDPAALQGALQRKFKGKTLMLRGFPEDATLTFDAELNPSGDFHQGSWLQGEMKIEKIKVGTQQIEFIGRRVGFQFDSSTQKFARTQLKEKVTLIIYSPINLPPADLADSIKNKIFIIGFDELHAPLPELLRGYVNQGRNFRTADGEQCSGKGIKYPKIVPSSNSGASQSSNGGNLQGFVVLNVLITEKGQVTDMHLIKPMGLGFDEKAAEAVRAWRFVPASKNALTIACRTDIEIDFNLH